MKSISLPRLMVLFLAFALLAAACGGDSETEGSGDSDSVEAEATTAPEESADDGDPEPADDGTEEPADDGGSEPADDGMEEPGVELTASARGVTPETINIGVSMLDFQALAELSLVKNGWGDQQLVHQTYIDALNARGGINGRTISPTFSYYSPLGTATAEATCLELTEDIETFAVLGGFLGDSAAPANTCLTGINETMVIGGAPTAELLEQSVAPWVLPGAQVENRLDAMLTILDDEGMLEGKKVGIIYTSVFAAAGEQAKAGFEARGVEVASFLENNVQQGEILAENDLWTVLTQRFLSDGADVVFIIGSGQAAVRGLDANGVDTELWVLNNSDLNNLGAETPKETARDAITITGLTDQERWEEPAMVACREIFTSANPDIEVLDPADHVEGEGEAWHNSIMNYCGYLALFELVATEAGTDLTHDNVRAAMENLNQFSLPGTPFASLGNGKAGASDSYRLSVFDPDASDPGELIPLTDVADGTP